MQRLAGNRKRRNCGYLTLGQFGDERVFLEDLHFGPAARPIKLNDNKRSVFEADLRHAIFIAVQRKLATVGGEARAVDGVQHGVGCQPGVRRWMQ